ncbi:hypothetical protein SBOR_9502 [Sclerotinia borealis F-4128]|uniref:F-box domain-containing protein n=1 Tax=Sclerotinia borealis (strain F-4128) TaxID=1432307 RepID=W9C5B8_SCLBF|nr:hypothetical protein SBOR_9502 [Sclerotinia borealis F-4128]
MATINLGDEGAQHRFKEDQLVAEAMILRTSHRSFEVVGDAVTVTPTLVLSECPDEIWCLIYQLCDVNTLKSVRLTNKRMSDIALRYLIESVLIFEFPHGEYGRYGPVLNSIDSTCRKYAKSFTYKTIGLRSTDITKTRMAFEHRLSFPERAYIGNRPWEKLTNLRLDYLFVYPKDLTNIFRINGRTLKAITLYKPILRGCNSWRCFFYILRHYHAYGIMNLNKLDLKGWLQWTHSESCVGCQSVEVMATSESYPYKISWMVKRGTERDMFGRKVFSKDPSKHITLQRAMEIYVIEGGKCYWNHSEFTVYEGPLQGFAVAEEQVRQELYQDGCSSPRSHGYSSDAGDAPEQSVMTSIHNTCAALYVDDCNGQLIWDSQKV